MAGRSSAPLTPRGALALAVSAGLLWEGYGRGELIAMVLGLSLGTTWVYALLTATLTAFLWRGFRGGMETRNNQEYRVYPASKAAWPGGGRWLAAVRYRVLLRSLRHTPPRRYPLLFDLPEAERWHSPNLPPRGTYGIVRRDCEVQDFLGFFRLSTARVTEEESTVLVVPVLPAPAEPKPLLSSFDGRSEGKSTYLRSEELYEIRPYLPGDDPRKINWKVWAHSGDLVLREGELLPPPSEEYEIRFWAPEETRNRPEREILFEELVRRAAGLCLHLLGEGKNLRFPQGGNTLIGHDDREAKRKLLDALAEPSREGAARDWPIQHKGSGAATIVFALPPGPGQNLQPALFRGTSVFTGPVSTKLRRIPRKLSLKDLCFEPQETKTPRPGISSRSIEGMLRALRREGIDALPL